MTRARNAGIGGGAATVVGDRRVDDGRLATGASTTTVAAGVRFGRGRFDGRRRMPVAERHVDDRLDGGDGRRSCDGLGRRELELEGELRRSGALSLSRIHAGQGDNVGLTAWLRNEFDGRRVGALRDDRRRRRCR